MGVLNMADVDLRGKRVLIREDLNVPLADGRVRSDKRIRAALPTIRQALDAGAAVLLMSHLGRPQEGRFDAEFSLQPVAEHLQSLLQHPVRLQRDWLDGVAVQPGEVVLLENVRFNVGEKANDERLSARMAALCDVFVMDAFGTAHRAQASTHGVGLKAPVACAGPLLAAELAALGRALENPARPFLAVVGGSKVSTKITLLEKLLDKVDQLIVGGGIANTFIAAAGHPVGRSLHEADFIDQAAALLRRAEAEGKLIPVPSDVVVADAFAADAEARVKPVAEVGPEEMILDIGPDTAQRLAALAAEAGTVVWNGPVGVFEFEQFSHGTRVLGQAIADSKAFSIAGGGDTLAAIDQFGIADDIDCISTGGGAFLEFLEGVKLPAVAMLEQRAAQSQINH